MKRIILEAKEVYDKKGNHLGTQRIEVDADTVKGKSKVQLRGLGYSEKHIEILGDSDLDG